MRLTKDLQIGLWIVGTAVVILSVSAVGLALYQRQSRFVEIEPEFPFVNNEEIFQQMGVAVPKKILSTNGFYISGQAKNTSDQTLRVRIIHFNLYNNISQRIGEAKVRIENFEPGSVWKFSVATGDVHTDKVSVARVEGY